jgi:cap3/cap4 methyltransferase
MSRLPLPWKRSRNDNSGVSAPASTINIVHYPSTAPFPVTMPLQTFPRLPYCSRNKEIKTSVHWGQRKLLISEIQLLSMYAKKGVRYHIVYAGSAPGTHIAFLDDLFGSVHTWELVDPGKFDRPVFAGRANFTLRNEFFTNQTAYGIFIKRLASTPALQLIYRHLTIDSISHEQAQVQQNLQAIVGTLDVARGTEDIPSMFEDPVVMPHGLNALLNVVAERMPMLFLSDIRTGCVRMPNFEDHVAENMKAQQCWTEILQADFAMLKFRLPYTFKAVGPGGEGGIVQRGSKHIDAEGCCEYLSGDMVIPIWTRPTSTEGRLVVPKGASRRRYNVQAVEDQFFFLNARLREVVHFNHLLEDDLTLDHHFDSAAEVHCLEQYCRQVMKAQDVAEVNTLRREIRRVSSLISSHLKLSFQAAIERRDFFVLKQAAAGIVEDDRQGVEDEHHEEPSAASSAKVEGESWVAEARRLVKCAFKERSRHVWWRNLDESQWKGEASDIWICTTMPQI